MNPTPTRRIGDIIRPWAELTPERPALADGETMWSYGALARAVCDTRCWLASQGVRPGDRLMIVGENGAPMIALLLAASEGDAWPVPVSALLPAREIGHLTARCDPRCVIYLTALSRPAALHAAAAGAVAMVHARLGRLAVGPLNTACIAEPVTPDPAQRVATMLYTSGSTGGPKGVMLTHENLLFVAREAGTARRLEPADRMYAALPVSHSVGLSAIALSTLMHGATLLTVPRFDPAGTLAALERDGVTMLHGVPAMFQRLTDHARKQGRTVVPNQLKFLSVSGAPLDATVKSATERLLGVPLRQGYGITECGPTIAMGRHDEAQSDLSVGRVLPGVEIRFEPPGDSGELLVRGPNVMKGYYRAPIATAEAIDADGWFRTHDIARLADGRLFIVGRTRELVISGGINVYPPDVEAVLNAHPAVAQTAVVGRRVPGDEELVAFVQLVDGVAVRGSDLAYYAADHLAPHQMLSEIVILPTLPTSPTGKIRKQQLAELAAGRPEQ